MSQDTNALALKSFGGLEIKDADKGEVEAIIATLNTLDRDHEVILPGAIADGSKVKLSAYGHGAMWGEAPVGKGTLHTVADKVHFRGKFFLSTDRGAEAFATLKELGPDQDWSFGFRVIAAENAPEEWVKQGAFRVLKKLEPFEVSPVIVGAGIGTRTVAMKCAGCEAKAAEEEAAKVAQVAAEAKAAHEAAAARAIAAAKADAATKAATEQAAAKTKAANDAAAAEFDHFQRTFRRFGVIR